MSHFQRFMKVLGGSLVLAVVACTPNIYVQPAPQLTFDQIIHDEVTIGARRVATRSSEPRSQRSPR